MLSSMSLLTTMTKSEGVLLIAAHRGTFERIAKRTRTSNSSVSRVFWGKQNNEKILVHLDRVFGPLLAELRSQEQSPRAGTNGSAAASNG